MEKMKKIKEPYKILIVDDEDVFLQMIQIMLNDKQYDVSIAHDGSEAVDLCFNNKFDLVLMDIMMPVMDGKTAAITIKKMSKNLPIVALTAFDVVQLEGMEQFNYIIRKPITKDALRKTIGDIIEKYRK